MWMPLSELKVAYREPNVYEMKRQLSTNGFE